ncbi:MAG: hypothetical protein HY564_00305 [Candidatus Jacksonbacteria bacterium]|nr:hypothetical protein [Candidatus Jacksonbacteria bacterium]
MSTNNTISSSQTNQTIETTTEKILHTLKDRYIFMMRRQVHSWKAFLILGFITGFAAAFLFTASTDLTEGLFAQPPVSSSIQNTSFADYEDTQGAQMEQVISDSVSISVSTNGKQPTQDTVPPGQVTDLTALQNNPDSAKQVELVWTAPGDDGFIGKADRYDIRFSWEPITDQNWQQQQQIKGVPKPKGAGSIEQVVVSNLTANTTYYFALKTYDESNNESLLSNQVIISIGDDKKPEDGADTTPPGRITTLFPDKDVTETSIPLRWIAVGDDNHTGTAFEYDIRYSTTEIKDESSFASALQITDEPKPQSAGAQESYTITNLQNNTAYWISIKVRDEAGNESELANVVRVETGQDPEHIEPGYVSKIKIVIVPEKNHRKDILQVRLRIRDSLTKQVKIELNGDADTEGSIEYIPNNVTKEIVDFILDAPKTLTKVVKNVDLSSIETAPLTILDIKVGNLQDADDVINSLDWAVLSSSWGTGDKDSDFNQDGLVNSLDWGIMNKNWNMKGDEN